ncbi:MAG: hypothetical protein OHK0046_11720 [Anaerolineae bacterium]
MLINESVSTPESVRAPISRRQALTITLIAVVIVFLLWNVAFLSPLAYPFRLFVTFVHEAGHSVMALLTGGEIVGFTISSNGAGLARTIGGNRALILPAGYLGAAMFGAVLFYVLNKFPRARTTAIILGSALITFTLLYARPDSAGRPIALIVGLLTGGGLVYMGVRARPGLTLLVLNVLAMMTALNAVLDVVLLVRYSDLVMPTRNGIVRNDAAAFSAEVIGLPASFWALLWAALAIVMMAASVYYAIILPMIRDARK